MEWNDGIAEGGLTMAEYIEREALLAAYDAEHVGPRGRARELIANAPAADVRPAVRGKWIVCGRLEGKTVEKCSACGQGITSKFSPEYHFCPNCGADMREGKL